MNNRELQDALLKISTPQLFIVIQIQKVSLYFLCDCSPLVHRLNLEIIPIPLLQ